MARHNFSKPVNRFSGPDINVVHGLQKELDEWGLTSVLKSRGLLEGMDNPYQKLKEKYRAMMLQAPIAPSEKHQLMGVDKWGKVGPISLGMIMKNALIQVPEDLFDEDKYELLENKIGRGGENWCGIFKKGDKFPTGIGRTISP